MPRDIAPGLLANLLVGVVEEFGAKQPILAAWDLALVAWGNFPPISRLAPRKTVKTLRQLLRTQVGGDRIYDALIKIAETIERDWDQLEWETEIDPEDGYPVEVPAWESSWVRPLKKAARQNAEAKLWYDAAMHADEILTDRAAARRERYQEQRYGR